MADEGLQTFAVRKVTEFCRGCGHPKDCHYGENDGAAEGPCHATIYAMVQMGVNANRCQCRRFA